MFCPIVKPEKVAVASEPLVVHGLLHVLLLMAAIDCSRPASVRFIAESSQKARCERLSAVVAMRT
jgi:hypothetical protein